MSNTKIEQKNRRKLRIRRKIIGTAERPRLAIRRTLKHINVLVIDDRADAGGSVTLIQMGTATKAAREAGKKSCNNQTVAKELGAKLAALAKDKGIKSMVYDRGGMKYHGVVKTFCDAVREGGIQI